MILMAFAIFGEPLVGGLPVSTHGGGRNLIDRLPGPMLRASPLIWPAGRHKKRSLRSSAGVNTLNRMKILRLLLPALLLPLAALAAERSLKVDKERSFVDVDVKATVDSFTGHLDAYEAKVIVDDAGRIKSAVFTFKFADLKTGKPDRDTEMIKWLGGGAPEGRYEMGNLAMTPDGQGQVSGRLTLHNDVELVEFPVSLSRADGIYTVTGETTIDTRTWGLKIIRKALVFKVDPEVKVRFKLVGVPVQAEEPKK